MKQSEPNIYQAGKIAESFGKFLIEKKFDCAVALFSNELRVKTTDHTVKKKLRIFVEGETLEGCDALMIAESNGVMSFVVNLDGQYSSYPVICVLCVNPAGKITISDLEWGYPD